MCHLAGYISNKNVIPTILESLEIQEPIIGAQATGLAILNEQTITMKKKIGPVESFRALIDDMPESTIGIGHTRYAIKNVTYAETNTDEKAHPFWNNNYEYVTMHNGTITNFLEYAVRLEKMGYTFRSKSTYMNKQNKEATDYCDSEIFGYLLDEEMKKGIEIKQAIRNACRDFQGQYAFVVLHPQYPEQIFIANWMQPIHIGKSKDGIFFTSFKEGFQPIKEDQERFKPPQNVLMTLRPGTYEEEKLHDHRELDEFNPDEKEFQKFIMDSISEFQNTIAGIWINIKNNPQRAGLTEELYESIAEKGGYSFSPLIYSHIQVLEDKNLIKRKLEYIWEGGIEKTPRYKFYLTD